MLHANASSATNPKEIVFIDQGIDDYHSLVNGTKSGIEIHILGCTQDGVLQMTNILNQRSDINAIHIVSHGNVGYLSLGNSVLSTDTLSKYQDALFSWQAGLKHNADILIYGCNVAKGLIGQQFIKQLTALTGANIAASSNLTGDSALGGNWELEVSTGKIFSNCAFREEKLRNFSSTLVTNTLNFTTDTVAADVTATHPTTNFGTISFKVTKDANSTGTANGSLTLASTGTINDGDNDLYYPGTDGEYLVIYTDGREVDFQSVKLGSIGATIYTDITGYAYKDGTLLGSQTINPVGANYPNSNVSITPETVTFTNSIFENADEIRLIGTNNFGADVVQLLIDDLVLSDAVPPNTTPAISIDNASLTYTENASATQIDAAATLSDADGDADWNGGTLVAQITANNEAGDQLSIVDNAVGSINTSGTNILNGATVIGTLSASEGTVTNGTALTITFNANATNALVQQVARAIHYSNTSDDPGTSNRTITFTATDTNAAGANDTRTVTVTAVNDEPTVTATGSNPTFTEGGAAASLFSGSSVSTVESGQTLSALTLTVTNVNDGSNERLNTDGTSVVLTNGTSGTTATNSLSYSVSVTGSTATVTFSGGTVSTAATQTLINAISYQNNSSTPNTNNRVVTITSLTDSGSNTGANDNVAALSISSTVAVAANPVITSATYDYNTNQLVVTGTDFVTQAGATNDVDISFLTFTGEGGASYTLTSAVDVEIDSATQFTITLSGVDIHNVEALLNKDGTASDDATTFNLAAADNWMTGTSATPDISDAINGITVSNVAAPAVTSATYDVSTGILVITGTNFVNQSGAANDLDASLLTFTGEAGETYTLTNTSDIDITSATSATITLSSTDQFNIQGLLNKAGTTSGGGTTYNLAVADNWLPGAPASTDIADQTNSITASNIQTPTVTSAAYDSDTGVLVVTGTNLFKKSGATNDIDISTLTLTGGTANATYTITSASDVEITSATSFSVTLTGVDKTNVDALLDQIGTISSGGSTYNLAAADDWLAGADTAANIADATNAVTVSINPQITSATYDATAGSLVVTGTNIQAKTGVTNDITSNKLTFTGEGGSTYTLTDSANVERDSATQFTVTLSATDKAAINQIINKNGTTSTSATTYNLAAADDWNANVTAADTSDSTGNAITASNIAVPTITSATYNASTGSLAVTGTGFLSNSGATNDIDASKFTFTGEGGTTYTLTDSTDAEITSGTAFTLTLSATDKATLNQIINKDGTASTDATTYNLAAAEDWAAGADAAVNVVDATGNGVTVSNVAVPTITSSTYNASTGVLVVTGSDFLKKSGATNDIDVSKFTLTGEGGGGAAYTLTDSADVEITSGTTFTVTLSATDKAAVNLIIEKTGTTSTDATTYNLAAAEDWATGADAAVNVVDATGNGITATIAAPPSGGGGSTPTPEPEPETTITTTDGVTTSTTVQTDGTVTTIIPIVENTRQDDPTTISTDHADIPVTTNSEGDVTLTVSIPVGVGLSVDGQPQALSKDDAINDLIQRIENKTEAGSNQQVEMTDSGQAFLDSLAADESISVQTIVPTVNNNESPNVPIIITGSAQASDSKQALVIDATNLPPGTILQLDNVAFAAIIGAVRVLGGTGENIAIGDNLSQFMVLGADNDILSGGGGDDTVGSLGGNDQTSGDAGNDIVYGGSANDTLSGGTGNDQLNGGFGFDVALQEGQKIDYRIETQGNQVIFTPTNGGSIDITTDVELVRFASGPSLAIAHSVTEAAAHHLAKTWLKRDLTVVEGSAVQNWQDADVNDIVRAFHELPEAAAFKDITTDELLAGLVDNPDIIQLEVTRDIIAGDGDDQGYLPLGLALHADGNAGYDVLRMQNSRSDVHFETVGEQLEITNLNDGTMFSITNAEAIAFDSGETVILTHNENEGILARIVHTFLDRNASIEEWQAGHEALADSAEAQVFFDWFHDRTNFDQLNDSEYIQTLFQNTLQRAATTDEINDYLAQLNDGSLNRDWLAVDIAQSEEAIAVIGSVIALDGAI